MAQRALFVVLLGAALLPSWAVTLAAPSGIKKVLSLLESMKQELVTEEDHEKKNFEKLSCYCKSESESLSSEIGTAEKQLPELQAETEALEASVTSLEAELKKDAKDNSEAQKGAAEVQELRDKTSQENSGRVQALSKNLQALDSAISLMRRGSSFLQMPTLELEEVLEEHLNLQDARAQQVMSFLQGDGAPVTAVVLGTLESLKDQLQQDYDEALNAQRTALRDFQLLMRSKVGEGRSLQEQLGQKSQRLGDLKLRLVEARREATEMSKLKEENQKLLQDLTESCSSKTLQWKRRAALRGDELSAVSEVLEQLAAPRNAVSFLQLPPREAQALQQLHAAASPGAQFIMLALKGKKIGTDEVVQMIDKMLEHLQEETSSEEKKKQNCRGQYRVVTSKQSALQTKQQQAEQELGVVQERLVQIDDDLKRMEGNIQDLDQSTEKATDIRKAERLSFSQLKSQALETQDLLESAKRRLEDTFLKRQSSFLQEVSSRFHRGRGADRAWGTSSHLRALGVTRLLDRILTDAQQELKEGQLAEGRAEAEYQKLLKDSAAKRSEEKFAIVQKRANKATVAAELKNSKALHAAAKKEDLANQEYKLAVDKECDWLLKNFKDRAAAREGEVQALQRAKATLKVQVDPDLSLAALDESDEATGYLRGTAAA